MATVADTLLGDLADYWPRVVYHPFCHAAADGTLEPAAFERWMIADYAFNNEYRRFIAGLMTMGPGSADIEVLSRFIPSANNDADLIVRTARYEGIDLDVLPGPTTIGFVSYLHALLADGYQVALSGFYVCQEVYFEGWAAVRAKAAVKKDRYWPFIDAWSSDHYADATASLARLVNRAAPDGPTEDMRIAARRVIRYELLFWTSIFVGETW